MNFLNSSYALVSFLQVDDQSSKISDIIYIRTFRRVVVVTRRCLHEYMHASTKTTYTVDRQKIIHWGLCSACFNRWRSAVSGGFPISTDSGWTISSGIFSVNGGGDPGAGATVVSSRCIPMLPAATVSTISNTTATRVHLL